MSSILVPELATAPEREDTAGIVGRACEIIRASPRESCDLEIRDDGEGRSTVNESGCRGEF